MTRPDTPDRIRITEDGRKITTITMKRHCPDGHQLGDVTPAELQAAVDGRPLPDVRHECPTCRSPR